MKLSSSLHPSTRSDYYSTTTIVSYFRLFKKPTYLQSTLIYLIIGTSHIQLTCRIAHVVFWSALVSRGFFIRAPLGRTTLSPFDCLPALTHKSNQANRLSFHRVKHSQWASSSTLCPSWRRPSSHSLTVSTIIILGYSRWSQRTRGRKEDRLTGGNSGLR